MILETIKWVIYHDYSWILYSPIQEACKSLLLDYESQSYMTLRNNGTLIPDMNLTVTRTWHWIWRWIYTWSKMNSDSDWTRLFLLNWGFSGNGWVFDVKLSCSKNFDVITSGNHIHASTGSKCEKSKIHGISFPNILFFEFWIKLVENITSHLTLQWL